MTIVRYIVPLVSKQLQKSSNIKTSTNLISKFPIRTSTTTWHRNRQLSSLLVTSKYLQQQSNNDVRQFHSTRINWESHLAKLRKKTGYAFGLCRKALEMHDQDLAKAEKWLRAEAAKQGWEKAQRVKSRSTGEGLIGIFSSIDRNQAAMVEVKCETDFVAKNEHFIELVTKLAQTLSQQQIQTIDARESRDTISKLWILDQNRLEEISGQLIRDAITKLGENIRLVRGCIIKINHCSEDTCLLPYTHAVAGKLASNNSQVILGKYGAVIAIQKKEPNLEQLQSSEEESTSDETDESVSSKSIEEVGSRLGQHIIGLSPITVAPPNQPKTEQSEIEAKSKEDDNDYGDGDEEPTALLKQKFIFNDEITVEQFLNNSNAAVLDFIRFECGEEIDVD